MKFLKHFASKMLKKSELIMEIVEILNKSPNQCIILKQTIKTLKS